MKLMSLKLRKSALLGGAALGIVALPQGVAAQNASPDTALSDANAIVVTARKTNESILDVPLAVSAVTAEDIEKRGITSINDIANFTPSINVNNNAASRNDRSAQQLIIRGFTPSAFTNPTASLFIDGVPVSSSSAISIISSPERIEVLKGPQSAYFGRNTFAGAVNVVNKDPARDFGGSVGGTLGTRDYVRAHVDLEGPLIGEWLRFRVTGDHYSKDGSWENRANRSETLGDQQTRAASLSLVADVTPDLTFKAFGMVTEDKDGPSDQALVSAYEIRDAQGNIVLPNQRTCVLNGLTPQGAPIANPFFCGVAPRPDFDYVPAANTIEDDFIKNFLASPQGRLVSPKNGVQGYGLKRRFYHLHFVADWEVGDTGVTLSSLTGYNNEYYSQLADIDNYDTTALPSNLTAPGARSYFDFPFYVEREYNDFSQEFRASYDKGGPFRGTLGASYLNARQQGGLGGGNRPLGTSVFSNPSGKTRSRTFGGFFGLTYDFTEALSVSLEGRYQIDKLYAYAAPSGITFGEGALLPAGFYPGGSLLVSETYKNFLPRAIVQFDVTPDIMVYASYSKGVNPGTFNTAFLSYSDAQREAAIANGINIAVDPEKVTNYEIGVKGQLFNRMLTFAMAAYYAPWRNQINPLTFNYVEGMTLEILRGSANTGSVDMMGVELEGGLDLGAVDINFAGSINDSDIKSFTNATITQLTGITDFSGNMNQNTSKYSASAGIQYTNALTADSDWYVRGDWTYKSGVYATPANIVRTPDLHLFKVRAGIESDNFSIAGFVDNLFNNKTAVSIDYGSVLTPNNAFAAYSSRLLLGLPDLRTFGIEAKYKF